MTSDDLDRETITTLQLQLGSDYGELTPLSHGNLRFCLDAPWGSQHRVVLLDRGRGVNEGAQTLIDKGYDTENDSEILRSIPDLRMYGIPQIFERGTLPDGRHYVVQEKVSQKTLHGHIEDHGPLSHRDFHRVFSQLLGRTFVPMHEEHGILHRDLKPLNILVNEDLETRVIDWQFSGKSVDFELKNQPTIGSHWTADPLVIEPLTGKSSKYSEQTNMYALGVTMLHALTGRYWFEYDPTGRFGRLLRPDGSVEDLLDDGKVSLQKHNEALEGVLKQLPKPARRYGTLIERCLTLNESKRYESLPALYQDFRSRKPRKTMRDWLGDLGLTALILGVAGGIGGIGTFAYLSNIPTHEQRALLDKQDGKIEIVPWWNEDGSLENNVVDLEVSIYSEDKEGNNLHYPTSGYIWMPEGGRAFNVGLLAKVKPGLAKRTVPTLTGTVYVVGYRPGGISQLTNDTVHGEMTERKPTFTISPRSKADNEMTYDLFEDKMGRAYLSVRLPYLESGSYDVAVELWEPTWKEVVERGQSDWSVVRIEDESKVITRVPVSLVVGDATPMHMGRVHRGFNKVSLYVQDPRYADGEYYLDDDGVEYTAAIRGRGFFGSRASHDLLLRDRMNTVPVLFGSADTNSHLHMRTELPYTSVESTFGDPHFLQITAREDGALRYVNWIPLQRTCSDCSDKVKTYSWDLDIPSRDLAYQLAELRESLK